MYLHEAIVAVLNENDNAWMTYREVADAIRASRLYYTKDGRQPENSQISARANVRRDLFEFEKSGELVRIRLTQR